MRLNGLGGSRARMLVVARVHGCCVHAVTDQESAHGFTYFKASQQCTECKRFLADALYHKAQCIQAFLCPEICCSD